MERDSCNRVKQGFAHEELAGGNRKTRRGAARHIRFQSRLRYNEVISKLSVTKTYSFEKPVQCNTSRLIMRFIAHSPEPFSDASSVTSSDSSLIISDSSSTDSNSVASEPTFDVTPPSSPLPDLDIRNRLANSNTRFETPHDVDISQPCTCCIRAMATTKWRLHPVPCQDVLHAEYGTINYKCHLCRKYQRPCVQVCLGWYSLNLKQANLRIIATSTATPKH
jgi:hypothetical protein